MNLLLNLKNKLAVVLSIVLVSTLFAFVGTPVKAEAATDNVSFYYSDNYGFYHGGVENDIYIKVKNIAYDKNVVVHYKNADDDTWYDCSATYVKSLNNGEEIWVARITNFGTGVENFCIKYEVNGETYWDNNSGSNYSITDTLGVAPIHVIRSPYYGDGNPKVTLKNYGYEKTVKVIYTVDDWSTQGSYELEYEKTLENGNEIWNGDVPSEIKGKTIEYYISYTVNGQTYYDSNFGENYSCYTY
ncbi:putative secreted protein [Clostridium bornimense]|uniref:Putative secreted protein n=1 Tax=Clostridium bornimense TaxID=1216932 RepID=W6RZT8_9CLOT|nr:carbohydrate-binding protein [Clostridium bornimense]CDM69973.1 putative secreted protein [Clostridium bornimense]